jgi:hypothetical protein
MANCGPRYAVMLCDLARACDRIQATRVNRASATALVRKLNAKAVAANGGSDRRDGVPIPLYYVLRHSARGAAGRLIAE